MFGKAMAHDILVKESGLCEYKEQWWEFGWR